jgi:hypothetical protein
MANMSPQLKFCSNYNWQNCTEPISDSSHCVSADRLNDVASIAIDLGLCCRFFRSVCFCFSILAIFSSCSDGNCSAAWSGYGGTKAWYPGTNGVDNSFRQQVGSYMCTQTDRDEHCPGLGGAGVTASASMALATPSSMSSFSA